MRFHNRVFRVLAVLATAFSFASAKPAAADPVVVELFTSQGCSSCPPADALLHELADREDVIALALHVDYWDYIGWKDVFANPAHSDRQRQYAIVAGRRSIYTPQMVVNGETSIVGAKAMKLADAIAIEKSREAPVALQLARQGDQVRIQAETAGRAKGYVVHMLRYQPTRDVKILRGENAGRSMSYANVVEDWRVLAEWSGRKPLDLVAEARGTAPVVVLIQAENHGRILAAQRLR